MKNNNVKRAIAALIVILGFVFLLDCLVGWGVDGYAGKYGLSGDYTKIEYLLDETDDDIVIIGSSIAINSLIPDVLTDSLGLSVFNGGCNAQNLLFFKCMISGMLRHHSPEYIVLALAPEDLGFPGFGRLSLLNPYFGKDSTITSMLSLLNDGKEGLFLHSNLYKYNTIWLRVLLQSVLPGKELKYKGFVPHDIPAYLPVLNDYTDIPAGQSVDSLKLQCLNDIIALTQKKGAHLIVTFPPLYQKLYKEGNTLPKQIVEQLCKENNIEIVDYSQSNYFLGRPELFYDNIHLNKNGALVFTNLFIRRLKEQGLTVLSKK